MRKRTSMRLFIGFVVVVMLLSGCLQQEATTEDEKSRQGEVAEVQEAEEEAEVQVDTRQNYNDVIYNEEINFEEFPTAITMDLEEKTEYSVYFEADKQIQFVVYSEQRYNEWKETGAHTISKATTKSGPDCCATSGTFNIDINAGEAGTYYFVFDDSRLPNKENLPEKGKLIVTRVSNI